MARIPLSLVNDEKNVVLQLVLIVVGNRLLDRAHPTMLAIAHLTHPAALMENNR
ncbi:hypothetical protein F7734_04600 [Scytonema sp. UIC 10036]|uniref:hypothetical protein n=1 Tax=Scytonema sp. UIC 10036 TaxID=2304196 RepID=UPI0012DA8D70|nr:hypothetical protein [Scytonema sp. UIC 10036]MUG91792.1 hypothetical protein [Scytonema sp. UIC 10036]